MAIVGVILGIGAMIVVDQLLKPLIPSGPHFLIACVAGAWVAWFFFRQHKEDRFNKLRPRKKKYRLSLPKAFKAVTDVLDLNTVQSQRWSYLARDPGERHIKAQITWTEKNTRIDGHGTGPTNISVTTVTDTFQHSLQIEVWFQDAGEDTTIVTVEWTPTVGSMNPFACDEVITSTMNAIITNLGEGEDLESDRPRTYKPGPPLVLLVITGLAMLSFTTGINSTIEERRQHYDKEKQRNADQISEFKERVKRGEAEIAEWQAFKRRHRL